MDEIIYNTKLFLFRKNGFFALVITIILAALNIMFIKGELAQNPLVSPMTSFEYFANVQGGASGTLFLILPLSISIATGSIFIKQKRSSIMSYSLVRSNINKFIKTQLFNIGALSFLFAIICQGGIFIATLLLFPNNNPHTSQGLIIFGRELLTSNPWIYSLIIILNSGLMASGFSLFSIIISIFFKNIYACLMLPYILLVGISQTMMAMPIIMGLRGVVMYDIAPLTMFGNYITVNLNIFTPTIYGIVMNILMFLIALYYFQKRFNQEKL